MHLSISPSKSRFTTSNRSIIGISVSKAIAIPWVRSGRSHHSIAANDCFFGSFNKSSQPKCLPRAASATSIQSWPSLPGTQTLHLLLLYLPRQSCLGYYLVTIATFTNSAKVSRSEKRRKIALKNRVPKGT
jgi:hypothetical protein